ncbi:hypothetical protein WN944_021048 [Citrus x changshan-huyou]|uniref:Uncharacterized protein n=1 Tax=Citrus x changshan-huyou TaxID=2935761 RepID=A0AAP0MW37_9ROSI
MVALNYAAFMILKKKNPARLCILRFLFVLIFILSGWIFSNILFEFTWLFRLTFFFHFFFPG